MSEINQANSITQALKELVPALPVVAVQDVAYSKYVATPPGWTIAHIDEENLLPAPRRINARPAFNRADSFVDYVKTHANDMSAIYLAIDENESKLAYVAVLDDNGKDTPAWRDHCATFTPPQAVEWERWNSSTGSPRSQLDFATWIEDNIADINGGEADGAKYPTGAEMLKLATDFEASSEKRFKSKTNLQSGGIRLELVDDDDAATRTNLDYFAKFRLGLRVFRGSDEPGYPMEVRLRHAVSNCKLCFTYQLIRPDLVFEAAAKEQAERIREQSGVELLYGNPF